MDNIDASLNNADWTKRTWDLPGDIQYYELMHGKDLAGYVAHLLSLPVARAMPEELRAQFAARFPALFNNSVDDESQEAEVDPVQTLTSLLEQLEAIKDGINKT